MARKVQFGAGIATAVLATLALLFLLFARVVVLCSKALVNGACPAGAQQRTVTLVEAGPSASFWVILIAMFALLYAGAAGAIADARFGRREGLLPLWICAVIAFMGCAFLAAGLGIFFAPSVIALAIAAYAAAIQRGALRRRPGLFGPRAGPAGPADPAPSDEQQ